MIAFTFRSRAKECPVMIQQSAVPLDLQNVSIAETFDASSGRTLYRATVASIGGHRITVFQGSDRLALERILRTLRQSGFTTSFIRG